MSDEKRMHLKRGAARLLRELARVMDEEPDRSRIEACARQTRLSMQGEMRFHPRQKN